MPTRPTHRFIATYKNKLAGAIVMSTPNSFSNLLGKENRDLEKLISRGACISWSPKNLASSLIMFGIRYMVKNTNFRFFTAYSDTEAKELGTIYQACNFIYLGQRSGAKKEYFDPLKPNRGWFSDRQFRKTSQIKRYAKEIRLEWRKEWSTHDKINWDQIPENERKILKQYILEQKQRCKVRKLHLKHKYVYILGTNKNETKKLKKLFEMKNPDLVGLKYPKERGVINTAELKRKIQEKNLTKAILESRPLAIEEPQNSLNTKNSQNFEKKYLTVKEAMHMMNISQWSIYQLIQKDPTFPVLNVGVTKKFVIDSFKLNQWLENKCQKGLIK